MQEMSNIVNLGPENKEDVINFMETHNLTKFFDCQEKLDLLQDNAFKLRQFFALQTYRDVLTQLNMLQDMDRDCKAQGTRVVANCGLNFKMAHPVEYGMACRLARNTVTEPGFLDQEAKVRQVLPEEWFRESVMNFSRIFSRARSSRICW